MPDERIIEYLRSRADVTPPPDLVGSVADAVERTPQQRHSWFAPFVPAAVAVGVAGAVLVAAVLVGKGPRIGPGPSDTPTPVPTASPTPSATPVPTETADSDALLEPGDTQTLDAVDQDGTWGTITVERGEEVGGYRLVSNVDLDLEATDARSMFFQNDPELFYLELLITYSADREPSTFGGHEWQLVIASSGEQLEAVTRGGVEMDLAPDMPGTNFSVVDPHEGELVFAVPRSAADEELVLQYAPIDEALAEFPVRDGGTPPEAVMTVIPPMSSAQDYIGQDESPITFLASEEADALFASPDTCTNPDAGYTVTFPDDWWTNTEIGEFSACTWFSPTDFEVADPSQVPDEVMVVINVTDPTNGIGGGGQALGVPSIDAVGGREAYRSEQVGVGGGFMILGAHSYRYVVGIDGQLPDENNLLRAMIAATEWELDDDPTDYLLHKAVLDRIMASLEFEDAE